MSEHRLPAGAATRVPPTTPDRPYVGPRALQTGELLCGRDREVRQLFNLLMAERIVLLYSPSGAGKTSLVQAALIPMLEREGLRVWPVVRVADPVATVRRDGARANPYVLSALARLSSRADRHAPSAPDLPTYLSEPVDPEVLIFDQFEEILTVDPTDRAAKQEFFTQVGAALRSRQRWALFVMREDYFAGLDPYLHLIPTGLAATFRLDLLGHAAARQAVQRPTERFGVTFADAAARKLVDDLRRVRVQRPDGSTDEQLGPHVEPVQLQVVCHRLWERRDPAAREILPRDVEDVGDVDTALAGYYAERVRAIAGDVGASERVIREWVQGCLITPRGIRGQVLQEPGRSQGLDNHAIERLEDAHLVRAERRRGATWYELAHDRLVKPLLADNAAWFAANLSPFQRRAELWERQGRPDELLLRGAALQEAERWVAGQAESLIKAETDFLRACRAGEAADRREREQREALAAEQQRAADRLRRDRSRLLVVSAVTLVAAALAVTFAHLAGEQGQRAEQQARIATSRQLAAQALGQPPDQYQLALLLGAEANSSAPTFEARSSLYTVLMSEPDRTKTLRRHTDAVTAVAFSPDGRRMASAGADQQVIFWDPSSSRSIGRPAAGHTSAVTSVAFSPDARWLVSGGNDGTLILWDAGRQQPVGSMSTGRGGPVSKVVFTDGGESLVSVSGDGTLTLWELATLGSRSLGRAFPELAGSITSVALTRDGRILALGDSDGALLLWDVDARGPLGERVTTLEAALTSLAFSADGRVLASGSREGAVQLWDVAGSPAQRARLIGHPTLVTAAAFNPDGSLLATASRDGELYVWDVASGQPIGSRFDSKVGVTSLAFGPDGRTLAAGSYDGGLVLRDLAGRLQPLGRTLADGTLSHAGLAFSPDGRLLASTGPDSILLLDATTHQPVGPPLIDGASGASRLAFSPDARWLVSGHGDGRLVIWDVLAAQVAGQLPGRHTEAVSSVAVSPDGKTIVSTGGDRRPMLWDLAARQPLGPPLDGHTGAVFSATFSPDGRLVASGGSDGILLWDLATRSSMRLTLDPRYGDPTGMGQVRSLAFSPDGARLASGRSDGQLVMWDVAARQALGRPFVVARGSSVAELASVAFSPDGQTLAAGYGNGTLILWDADTHQQLGPPLAGHLAPVTGAAFSPDGQTLASVSSARPLLLWDVAPSSWRARACALAGRNLAREEWDQYFPRQSQRKTCPDLPDGSTESAGDPSPPVAFRGEERRERRTMR